MLNRFNHRFLIFVCFLLFFASPAGSEEISVEVSLDRSTITVGDPVLYRLIVRYDTSLKIIHPKLGQNLKKFEIKDYKTLPVLEEEGKRVEETQYLLTVFEVGSYEIPPIEIRYSGDKSILTSSLMLEVKAVNTEKIDDIKDIKGPLEIKWNWRPLARGVGLLMALLGAGWGMFYLIRRWRQGRLPQLTEEPEVLLSPEEEALAALKNLRENGWENVKQFYGEVSDILRRYVGRRYQFGAMEQTSEELKEHLKYKDIGEKPFGIVKNILSESDLVKFAKYIPSQKIAEGIFPQMERIIEFTRPKPFAETASETVELKTKTDN